MNEKVNAVRDRLYRYNDRDMLADGRFILFTGDLIWKEASDLDEIALRSSRGLPMRYTPHEFLRLEDDETFTKVIFSDTTDDDVEQLADMAENQEFYRDAYEYLAARDGSFAVAHWFCHRAVYRLERMDDHFTWLRGEYHNDAQKLSKCGYAAFNPTGLQIVPENAMARRTRMKGRSMLGQIGDAVKTRSQWPDLKDILQFSISEAIQNAITEACRNG